MACDEGRVTISSMPSESFVAVVGKKQNELTHHRLLLAVMDAEDPTPLGHRLPLQLTCMSDAWTESTIAELLAEIRQVGREVLLLVESECFSCLLDVF